MRHSKKYRSYYLSSWNRDSKFSVGGGGRGVVGYITTYVFSHQVNFSTDGHYGLFWPSQIHYTASLLVSYSSKDYPVSFSGGSPFDVVAGDVKGGVVPRTTHLYSHEVDFS